MTNLPWYPRYPKDFMTDEAVKKMGYEAQGLYNFLLDTAWIEGSIPADEEALARLAGLPLKRFRRLWRDVKRCWHKVRGGRRLFNPRMQKIRKEQEAVHLKRVEAGTKGGRPLKAGDKPGLSPAKARLKPGPPESESESKSETEGKEEEKAPPPPGTAKTPKENPTAILYDAFPTSVWTAIKAAGINTSHVLKYLKTNPPEHVLACLEAALRKGHRAPALFDALCRRDVKVADKSPTDIDAAKAKEALRLHNAAQAQAAARRLTGDRNVGTLGEALGGK